MVVPGANSDFLICQHVGRKLFSQNWKILQENCQIHANSGGEDIVQCMLLANSNNEMEWPSVFGSIATLPHFWLDRPQQPTANLMPIRFVMVAPKLANVCVDVRWLLLYCSLCGTVPSQSSRFLGVARWIDYFYHMCVPDRMVCSPALFTGLPSPVMDSGMVMVPYRSSGRKTLLRSPHMMQTVGLNAPIKSTAVEDLGPAALRYQLAKILGANERALPTDSVSYSFPIDQWCPVCVSDGVFASLKWRQPLAGGGGFVIRLPGQPEAPVPRGEFLSGRIELDVRPLCMFDRGGVVVRMLSMELGLLLAYDPALAVYRVAMADGSVVLMNPYDFEDAIVPIGGDLLLKTSAFPNQERYRFIGLPHADLLCCKLSMLLEQTGMVAVSVNVDLRGQDVSAAQYGSSHGNYQRARQRMDISVRIADLLSPADALQAYTNVMPLH